MNKTEGKLEVIIFLVLSLISGFFEIGSVMWAIEVEKPVYVIVGIGIMYQLGNLVPVPFTINKRITIFMLFSSLVLSILVGSALITDITILVVVALTAAAIQNLRSNMKNKVGTTIKRVFRVLGFMIAPFFSLNACIVGIVLLLIITFFMKERENNNFRVLKCKITHINIVMIAHQMHYFGYVYFMLIILSKYVTSSNMMIGLIFIIGWITYLIVPHIMTGKAFGKYFICGHVFLTIVLFVLAINYDTTLSAILWILTGFGGGTVFCIKELNTKLGLCSSNDIVFSENIGHILGAVMGMLSYYSFKSYMAPIIFSMICALSAVIGMSFLLYRGGKEIMENVRN